MIVMVVKTLVKTVTTTTILLLMAMMAMMAMGGMQGQGMGALQSSTGGLPGAEALGAGSGMAPAINPAMMSQLSGMFPHMQQQGMGLDNNLMARNMELLQNMATQGTGSGPSGGMMGEISGRGRQPRNQMHQQRGFGHGLGSSSGASTHSAAAQTANRCSGAASNTCKLAPDPSASPVAP